MTIGGSFTVSGGTTSKVLAYNPVVLADPNNPGYNLPGFDPGPRTVLLVGGSRLITPAPRTAYGMPPSQNADVMPRPVVSAH